MERELHISRREVQELLKIPKALMERFTKWTDLNCFLSLVRRGGYLFFFLFELETRLVSKPTASSRHRCIIIIMIKIIIKVMIIIKIITILVIIILIIIIICYELAPSGSVSSKCRLLCFPIQTQRFLRAQIFLRDTISLSHTPSPVSRQIIQACKRIFIEHAPVLF